MKGLELCREFYARCARDAIKARFGERAGRIAAGLAGEGSECLGFDDEISRDHDFGPGFCLWLSDEDFAEFGAELRSFYDGLPAEFMGFRRNSTPQGAARVGVMRIGDFYARFTGSRGIPESEAAWLRIPEHALAAATSGVVFDDPPGEFSRIRSALLPCYPEEVRLKKLAARLFTMAQAGQYNYPRMTKRGDAAAASFALAEFAKAAFSALHLLNRRYAPYYKWLSRSAQELPKLSESARETAALFEPGADRENLIESVCARVRRELREEGLSSSDDPFLVAQAVETTRRIKSEYLRKLSVTVG
ncbi:DUF4037 domain-containing protein [Cloacibacillus sp. An23]|uniref:DUF4037 domain-containing protein n=1 Tax=Cloacibacillus sp. An23 TaxID=1965591 RepID=UPI000B3AE04C|nr:DUF4037 domain-containing protein [Cloacibacillus sp. An23]OUO94054.1 hypothetical protein B5F39_05150 [Cloacibacillus sp. An23]